MFVVRSKLTGKTFLRSFEYPYPGFDWVQFREEGTATFETEVEAWRYVLYLAKLSMSPPFHTANVEVVPLSEVPYANPDSAIT